MRGVKLEHVEPGAGAAPRCLGEGVAHGLHVGAGHLARHLVLRRPWHGRGAHDWPSLAGIERRVVSFPADARRALGPAMAQLQRNLGSRALMHEAAMRV